MPCTEIAAIAGIAAGAAFLQSVAGFGSALVAMPLLTMLLGVAAAAPLQALCGVTLGFAVLWRDRHALHVREALRLVAASMCGVPFGIVFLRRVDADLVTRGLGAMLLAYAAYALLLEPRLLRRAATADAPAAPNAAGGLAAGFLAGLLGGAYNTDGPPLVMYGTLQRWPKAQFRSVLQTVFLCNGWVVVAGHAVSGNVTPAVGVGYLIALPGLALGIAAGRWLDRRLHPGGFRIVLLALIAALGAALLGA